jgi:hypothetical protein
MRKSRLVLVIAMLSVGAVLMAVEPHTDEEAMSLWIQAKCNLSEKDISFTWNSEGFIVAYGRSPSVNCTYKILYKTDLAEGIVEYWVLQERYYCNMFYIVYVDIDGGRIDELSCFTVLPDSESPSGYFDNTVYRF